MGYVEGVSARAASVRRDMGLSSCWTEPVSSCSKTDPLLSKAKSITDASGDCDNLFKNYKKTICSSCEREVRTERETSLAHTKFGEEGGGGDPLCNRQRFPYSP